MKSSKFSLVVLFLFFLSACGGGGGDSGSASVPSPFPPGGVISSPPLAGANILAITVNGPDPLNNSYVNEPCVTVTVCTPGTTNCQTIPDILLDTGSFGLRVFRQALSVPLNPVASGSGLLAECVQFADGTSAWGPVQTAGVILGGEPAVQVPVQVVDATFGTVPGPCPNPLQSPSDAGYNGILGVGLFLQDCGSDCVSDPANGTYFSCNGPDCTGTPVDLARQVQNPVALLPQDNNGVIVQLPGVPVGGAASVRGNLVLGIGTQSNNAPAGATAYGADAVGEIRTEFNGKTYPSFIDSGSNGLFFPPPADLPICPAPNSVWFCPPSTVTFSATNLAASGSPRGEVSFQIANLEALIRSGNRVFNDLGGNSPVLFDWGLPFFFGRNVIVGFDEKSSTLGTGPYWAY